MLLLCTECGLPYYTLEDLEDHVEIAHPAIHRENNRLEVRIFRRMLGLHRKTYRCWRCYSAFPHPDLRDEHLELEECDPDDVSEYARLTKLVNRRALAPSITSNMYL
ncbi:hypothetical protein B0H10DRAFT_2231337 [Mycena sp. CBHHK59/15]|nr:hypothetical protein B0H10DRAFT_2231337 [Mycena sp. CBHHK59/15]